MRDKPRRLGLVGWFKARRLEWKLRRRWKTDADWRARVQATVTANTAEIIKQRTPNTKRS